jgi:triphosphoribosyl-dephospho-CoA synthase
LPGRHFSDLRYEDFLASAAAIGGAFAHVGERRVGETIRDAVHAARSWARSNSNLGIVLLLAPLARAARLRMPDTALRDAVRLVLGATTVEDARDVYTAIRRAVPGGLGRVEPTLPLLDVMRLAERRDSIASEYATGFALTFERGWPALHQARLDGLSWDDAVVETFLALLASTIDTHIARKVSAGTVKLVMSKARDVVIAGGVRTEDGRRALGGLDNFLRDGTNLLNPGTTADLVAAAIFVELVEGVSAGGSPLRRPA